MKGEMEQLSVVTHYAYIAIFYIQKIKTLLKKIINPNLDKIQKAAPHAPTIQIIGKWNR